MEPLVIAALAVLVCLVALHLLDRRLEAMDRLQRQHEAALQRVNLLHNLRRTASPDPEDAEAGDLGGVPHWPRDAAA